MTVDRNFTEVGGKDDTYEGQICSVHFSKQIYSHLVFLSGFNVLLSIFICLGNGLILVALHKESTLHSPSKQLLRSLAITDLCVGIVTDPLSIVYWISSLNDLTTVCLYALSTAFVIGYTLTTVSLLTTSAISVDRLLAVVMGVRYRQTVTLKRVYGTVITFWVLASVASFVYIKSFQFAVRFMHTVIIVSLTTSMFSYTKVFLYLRQYGNQIHDKELSRDRQELPSVKKLRQVRMAKQKKAASSVMWIQIALIVCYLPYGVVLALPKVLKRSQIPVLIRQYAVVSSYTNSLLNPLLYCWKIKEVRLAVMRTLRACRR